MKVRTAKICLNCDAVYEGGLCPDCAGKKFICLSKYFKPQYEESYVQNRKTISRVDRIEKKGELATYNNFSRWQ